MPTTYTLTPNPIWNSFDLTGRPAGGAYLYSFKNDDPNVAKPIFQDAKGVTAWTNPIMFNSNGEAPGMMFFSDDGLYNLELHVGPTRDTALIWGVYGFGPSIAGGGGSGGGGITPVSPVTNYITNGVFYHNIGASALPIDSTNLVIAPSNHDLHQPDIRFIKNSITDTDQIVFNKFSPIGGNELTPDATPEYYLQYTCTNHIADNVKSIQVPICKHVQNLSGENVTLQFWAKSISGAATISLYWYQFFGDGGSPSTSFQNPFVNIPTVVVPNFWKEFNFSETVPSVAGKTLGDCGNDALYLRFGMPLANCQIQFTKPEMYIGTFQPPIDFSTYDEIDAIINSPRTGDIVTSMRSTAPLGWLGMNDSTIGSSASGATRANVDTFPLFKLLWEAMHNNPTYAPIYTSSGIATTYGADAVTDYSDATTGNKRLSLPKSLGQVFAGTGSVLPAISYTPTFSTSTLLVSSTASFGTGVPVIIAVSPGGAVPLGLIAGRIYFAINISTTTLQLALTLADALSGTPVPFTNNGTGTQTIQVKANAIGTFEGEGLHTMTVAELANHSHMITSNNDTSSNATWTKQGSSGGAFSNTGTLTTGSSTPFNVVQPTTYMNVFIKL